MKTLEKSGTTIDDAIDAAVAELGCSREDVTIEIITMPSKGIFGIGAKPALVRVSVEDSATAYAMEFLDTVFKKFGLDVMIRPIEGEEFITLDLVGKDLGILIGRRGETLDALQYLTSLYVNRGQEGYTRVTLDTENYRAKREEALRRLANRMANRAIKTGRKVVMEPMNPYERRILHSALQQNDAVTTHSEGEEPNRHVVITLKQQ